jgi:L-gulonolactone oxidase
MKEIENPWIKIGKTEGTSSMGGHTGDGASWTNWAGNVQFEPTGGLREPESEAEIIALVRDAARRRVPLRVVGHGHSFNPSMVADGGGVAVSLRRYKKVLQIDAVAGTVTCEAGISLVQLCEALAEHEPPLTLENVPVVLGVTVGGALATAAHGSGAKSPSLSAQLLGCTLIDGRGALLRIDASTNAELLPAARASLGVLGVFSTTTLRW